MFLKMLTSFGNKYLVASFLRVGVYETDEGIQVIIADPETINRIIFNDGQTLVVNGIGACGKPNTVHPAISDKFSGRQRERPASQEVPEGSSRPRPGSWEK